MSMKQGAFKVEDYILDEARNLGLNVSKICRDSIAAAVFFRQRDLSILKQRREDVKDLLRTYTSELEVLELQLLDMENIELEMENKINAAIKILKESFPEICKNTVIDDIDDKPYFRSTIQYSEAVPSYYFKLVKLMGDSKVVLTFIKTYQDIGRCPTEKEIVDWVTSELSS